MGALTIVVLIALGPWFVWRGLGLRQERALAVGLACSVLLHLLSVTLLVQAGFELTRAVYLSPLPLIFFAFWGQLRPASARYGPGLSRLEKSGLGFALVFIWLLTNLVQVASVDDDYWLHTPVQARMLRGTIPPTNPYFPDLILGGHFSRDLLIASTSILTGRDTFGAQALVASVCHTLGLAVLYLGLRGQGGAGSAAAGTGLVWLGMNVSGRVGLIDFFHNNGALTYLTLALLICLWTELWRDPEMRLAIFVGSLLGFFSLIYESHFGLVVLALLSLMPWLDRPARLATAGALGLSALLALTGGGALSRMVAPRAPLDQAIAAQTQTVRISFPKDPFFALRIERWDPGPVSVGYRSGLGVPLLSLIDREPARVDDRYVRLSGWMVLRMHWLGVWLAPFSAWLLWRQRNRFGQFLWLFGFWAYVVPGIFDFGSIHEYEWYRWEFAAGYGFAGAAGAALGALARTRRSGFLLFLLLLLFSEAGLRWTARQIQQLPTVSGAQILGLEFQTRAWLLRHGAYLRLDESDLRTLAWIPSNPNLGRGALIVTTKSTNPWDVLFESTVMGLVDVQALGHRLPPDTDPIGLPPYRRTEATTKFLESPSPARARELGIDWLYLRSDDFELERRLLETFPVVYVDGFSRDGKRRFLFAASSTRSTLPEISIPAVDCLRLELQNAPSETERVGLSYSASGSGQSWSHGPIALFQGPFYLGVPSEADTVTVSYYGRSAVLEQQRIPIGKAR